MSNESKEEALPTAAIVDNPNSAKYEHCLKIPVASKKMSKDVLEWGDELVRRQDVEALIQDKINRVRRLGKEHNDEFNADMIANELEELLGELEQ